MKRFKLTLVLVLTLVAAATQNAFAQEATPPTETVGGASLSEGVAVTGSLETADLLLHLGLLGWAIDFTADEEFSRVTVAVVALERPHLDAEFERVPVSGGFTVERPRATNLALIGLLLDGDGDRRTLTLRVGDSTSQSTVDLPPVLSDRSRLIRRPFETGIVLPSDEQGRFVLAEVYPSTDGGVVGTGDTADMLAYLALEISVD